MQSILFPALLSTITATGNIETSQVASPWFTGPLLTSSPFTVELGHYNINPYLFIDNNTGLYNKHWHAKKLPETASNINLQFITQIGVTHWMDFTITPQFFYNYVGQEQSSWRFGDLYTELGFQLSREKPGTKIPTVKFAFGELFPTGPYEHLDPENLGTDTSGSGSFQTTFKLVFAKRFNPYGNHFLGMRYSAACVLGSQVHVHGKNAYGGDSKTQGTVVPGAVFPILMGFEYSLTQNWVLALDIANTFALKTKFKGRSDISLEKGWSYSLSFAPAIEYNYSQNIGIIGGVWVSAKGRNSAQFINYVIALDWYI